MLRSRQGGVMKKSEFNPWRCIAAASGAGITLLVCIGVGVFLGVLCDRYFGTEPFGLIFLSLLGGVAGMWSIARQMMGK